MSASDVLIVGEDISALVLAATATAVGRSTVLMSTGTQPPPRPLPLPDDREWQRLRRLLPGTTADEWHVFHGGRRRDTPQALPMGCGELLRVPEQGVWRTLGADPGEGWSELPDWLTWSAQMLAAAEKNGLRHMAKPAPLVLRGGILRKALLEGAPPARRILILDPGDPPAVVKWPAAWPRTFADEHGAWWAPIDGNSVALAGTPQTPPGWTSVVGSLGRREELPWGVASCRGVRVAAVPPAASTPAAVWLAWMFDQLRWLGVRRRDVGKASQVAV